jgi:hypothetical protein
MGLKLDAYVGVAAALVIAGVYLDRKYTAAGGASGIAQNAVVNLFTSVGDGIGSLASAAVDAVTVPASTVPAVVDQVQAGVPPGQTASTSQYLWESALMGGGS